jgi:O-methyltransferase
MNTTISAKCLNEDPHKTSQDLLRITPVISGMVTEAQVEFILDTLEEVLVSDVDGDVVELGCNSGTTSIFIRKMLSLYESPKTYHVYDSFLGLPENSIYDTAGNAGECLTDKATLMGVFNHFNLQLPTINEGWFADIDDENYPDRISFAFLDGDFYPSIMDSFAKIYHKLEPGAMVVIHDYGPGALAGVEKACSEFLADKPENVEQAMSGVGVFTKL